MKVSELGEFRLIELLEKMVAASGGNQAARQQLVIGIGDDAAAWQGDGTLQLATTDSLVQDVHFSLDTATWYELGWKSLAISLSDIAAMGGVPQYALVTLALPPDSAVEDVTALFQGMLEQAQPSGIAIAGGDIVRSSVIMITTTVTGSIGVVLPHVDLQQLFLKIGVQPDPIKSGAKKDIGASYRSLEEEERKLLQEIVDKLHGRFTGVVSESLERRGKTISPETFKEITDGRILDADTAVGAGLVDAIGYMEDAGAQVRKLAKVKEARLIRYRKYRGLAEAFFGSTPAAPPVVDFNMYLPQRMPAFMYLWIVGETISNAEPIPANHLR